MGSYPRRNLGQGPAAGEPARLQEQRRGRARGCAKTDCAAGAAIPLALRFPLRCASRRSAGLPGGGGRTSQVIKHLLWYNRKGLAAGSLPSFYKSCDFIVIFALFL